MKWVRFGIPVTVALGTVVAGCRSFSAAGGGDMLPPALPPGSGISAADEWRARELYVAKCAKCHRFYPPASYSDAAWAMWMDKMSRKSKLQPEQEDLLSRYLGAFRQDHTSDTATRPEY